MVRDCQIVTSSKQLFTLTRILTPHENHLCQNVRSKLISYLEHIKATNGVGEGNKVKMLFPLHIHDDTDSTSHRPLNPTHKTSPVCSNAHWSPWVHKNTTQTRNKINFTRLSHLRSTLCRVCTSVSLFSFSLVFAFVSRWRILTTGLGSVSLASDTRPLLHRRQNSGSNSCRGKLPTAQCIERSDETRVKVKRRGC